MTWSVCLFLPLDRVPDAGIFDQRKILHYSYGLNSNGENMIPASELKNGIILRMEKRLYKALAVEYHMGGGRMGGLVHVKFKDMRTGLFLDRKFKPEERLEIVELDRRTMEYLYKDAEGYYMMDPESFEQIQLSPDLLANYELPPSAPADG